MGSEESQPQQNPRPQQQYRPAEQIGSGESQPQQNPMPQQQHRPAEQRDPPQNIQTEPQRQQQQENVEERVPDLIYTHEKYEELTYNVINSFNTVNTSNSSPDLFYISICYPYYCTSVYDMIRQAIRVQSMATAREQPDYQSNFLFTENMAYNRIKVLERCSFRRHLTTIFEDANPLAIKYNSDSEEINFSKILLYLRDFWAKENRDIISQLQRNFQRLTNLPEATFSNQNRMYQILSQVMGEDMCSALIPRRDINWEETDTEYNHLTRVLANSKSRLCMTFSKTKPLNSITIEGHVIRHGICSNGKFLFILTDRRELFVYLIYKGLIYDQKRKLILDENMTMNNETYLFCSQRWLFIRENGSTHQIPISDLINSENIQFEDSTRPDIINLCKACSNGATYSIINQTNNSFQVYDAGTERRIINSENRDVFRFMNDLHHSSIIVTNGGYIGTFLHDGSFKIVQTFDTSDDAYSYTINDFPKDDDLDIEAMTIDVLSSVYFSVTFDGTNSKVYSHPYTGSLDLYIFGLKMWANLSREEPGNRLLKYLLPVAFSKTIPENLISQSEDTENDLMSIANMIKKYQDDRNLSVALMILLDLNLTKLENKNVARSILPTIIEYLSSRNYKRISSAFLVNNFDLFFDSITATELEYLKEVFMHSGNVNGDVFNECMLTKLSHSSLLTTITINDELLTSLFGEFWFRESRKDEERTWLVDLLLISQQISIEEISTIIEKDPLNLNDSSLINSVSTYANFLIDHFYEMISQIIELFPEKQNRRLNYDCILYTLINNFFASAAPITNCTQLANIMTNDKCISIIKILSDDFQIDEQLNTFIGYFDMIYTVSISGLIRGGNAYQCEIDYPWLIHRNIYNGNRDLTPPEISQAISFLSSLENNFIKNKSEDMNYLYQKIKFFKFPRKDYEIIDRFIMAAITHQTNSFHLLSVRNENDQISPQLRAICFFLRKIRS